MLRQRRNSLVVLVAALAGSAAFVQAQTTVSFQPGVNDYNGLTDLFIGVGNRQGGITGNRLGSAVENFFLDGVENDTASGGDTQGLFRFDGLFGSGPGQIPLGSKITSAKFALTTAVITDAQTGGSFGVSALKVPFDSTTTWSTAGSQGQGYRSRFGTSSVIRANGFSGLRPVTPPASPIAPPANMDQGIAYDSDVTHLLQDWSNGAANNGFLVTGGTTNGWSVLTSGSTNVAGRPKLEVTYEAPSTTRFKETVIRQGLNGYTGTTMGLVDASFLNPVTQVPEERTLDGSTVDSAFLDGPVAAAATPNIQALVKFDNIFGSAVGQVAPDAVISKAYLVVTTASGRPGTANVAGAFQGFSVNSATSDPYSVHQMLTDWDLDAADTTKPTLFSEFGLNGTTVGSSSAVSPALDTQGGMVQDSEAHFDVTSALLAWQQGQSNFGLNIQIVPGFDDGWAIKFLGAPANSNEQFAPPRLVIVTEDLTPSVIRGDFGGNESPDGSFNTPDGTFDGLDIEGFLLALNSQSSYLALNPTLSASSLVDLGDFGGNESTDGSFNSPDGAFDGLDIEGFLLALNDPAGYAAIQPPGFGGVSAIPEPAALGLLAPLGLLLSRRRR